MRSLTPLLALSLLVVGLAACGTDDPAPDCSDADAAELCQPDLDAGDSGDDENDADADAGGEPDADAGGEPDADAADEPDADAADEPDADAADEPDADAADEPDADVGGEINPDADHIEIQLEWTESDPLSTVYSDLDLYYCQEGVASLEDDTCVYWGEDAQAWGPGDEHIAILSNDGADEGEVELIEHATPADGRYLLGVQAYWDDGSGVGVGEITATLRILVDDVEVYTATRVFDQTETMWYAAIMDWPELTAGGGAGISEGPGCVASDVNTCLDDGIYVEMVNFD